MAIPTIETERLILREPRVEDFPAYAELMASERAEFMGGPFDKKAAWGMFCHGLALWQMYGHGSLMIELKSTGQCIGELGINAGPFYPEKELGWMLYDGHEGQGYAFEAALAFRSWAFDALKLPDLVSYIDDRNAGSIKLAERMGAVRDDNCVRQDPEDVVYRHYNQGLTA
ncbi:GNAT family N-acetyltransferase [Devosia sp. WQ 349]|uniref:GNAT family N-acetyltransferase n=1 Tax=Devosia sp. WQ 349K1 TaxID=2800329 RepID=UPI001908367C|nr:GNAT family N-acetyltransferase [Devosia sp. WQ 349K1]